MELFAFDIDGTISVNSAPLMPLEKEMMNKILARGDAIVIASGRAFPTVKYYLDQLIPSPHKYAVCSNGADVYEGDGREIFSFGLTYADFLHLKEAYWVPDRGREIYTFNGMRLGSFAHGEWVDWELEKGMMGDMIDYSKTPLKPTDPVSKVLIATHTSEESNRVASQISDSDRHRYAILRSSPVFLEFVNLNSDKAKAISAIAKSLSVSFNKVHAFGDAMNDASMLSLFDGTAMGNAFPEVKALAKRVTLPVTEDGVGVALRDVFHIQ